MSLDIFLWLFWSKGLAFLPWLAGLDGRSSNFTLCSIAEMSGIDHQAQLFSIKTEYLQLFCLGLHRTVISLFAVSPCYWDDKHMPLCQAIRWDGVSQIFCLCLPQTVILPITAS
jgi:hypothetical protein